MPAPSIEQFARSASLHPLPILTDHDGYLDFIAVSADRLSPDAAPPLIGEAERVLFIERYPSMVWLARPGRHTRWRGEVPLYLGRPSTAPVEGPAIVLVEEEFVIGEELVTPELVTPLADGTVTMVTVPSGRRVLRTRQLRRPVLRRGRRWPAGTTVEIRLLPVVDVEIRLTNLETGGVGVETCVRHCYSPRFVTPVEFIPTRHFVAL